MSDDLEADKLRVLAEIEERQREMRFAELIEATFPRKGNDRPQLNCFVRSAASAAAQAAEDESEDSDLAATLELLARQAGMSGPCHTEARRQIRSEESEPAGGTADAKRMRRAAATGLRANLFRGAADGPQAAIQRPRRALTRHDAGARPAGGSRTALGAGRAESRARRQHRCAR